MATNQVFHNLDEDLAEYFEFQLLGKRYKFRYMTVDEIETMYKIEQDDAKVKEFLRPFITKVDEDAPDIFEIYRTMPINRWRKFIEMVKHELRVA